MMNRKRGSGREDEGKRRGAGFGVGNGVGDGGSYGYRTGGLNLGGQHFNNRWKTDIPEATKSRTGDEEDHRPLRSPTDDHVGPGTLQAPPSPLRIAHSESPVVTDESVWGERFVCPVVRALGKTRARSISNHVAWLQA